MAKNTAENVDLVSESEIKVPASIKGNSNYAIDTGYVSCNGKMSISQKTDKSSFFFLVTKRIIYKIFCQFSFFFCLMDIFPLKRKYRCLNPT